MLNLSSRVIPSGKKGCARKVGNVRRISGGRLTKCRCYRWVESGSIVPLADTPAERLKEENRGSLAPEGSPGRHR